MTDTYLTPDALGRAEALDRARNALGRRAVPIGTASYDGSIPDLIAVAEWILGKDGDEAGEPEPDPDEGLSVDLPADLLPRAQPEFRRTFVRSPAPDTFSRLGRAG